jgi:hypothetical protein
MRYQLVVSIKPATSADFDLLVNWEDVLISRLVNSADVDGHDLGAGEFHVFILTDNPSGTFQTIQSLPETRQLARSMECSYRTIGGDDYTILWPE